MSSMPAGSVSMNSANPRLKILEKKLHYTEYAQICFSCPIP
jgi:hypothetical protein